MSYDEDNLEEERGFGDDIDDADEKLGDGEHDFEDFEEEDPEDRYH